MFTLYKRAGTHRSLFSPTGIHCLFRLHMLSVCGRRWRWGRMLLLDDLDSDLNSSRTSELQTVCCQFICSRNDHQTGTTDSRILPSPPEAGLRWGPDAASEWSHQPHRHDDGRVRDEHVPVQRQTDGRDGPWSGTGGCLSSETNIPYLPADERLSEQLHRWMWWMFVHVRGGSVKRRMCCLKEHVSVPRGKYESVFSPSRISIIQGFLCYEPLYLEENIRIRSSQYRLKQQLTLSSVGYYKEHLTLPLPIQFDIQFTIKYKKSITKTIIH